MSSAEDDPLSATIGKYRLTLREGKTGAGRDNIAFAKTLFLTEWRRAVGWLNSDWGIPLLEEIGIGASRRFQQRLQRAGLSHVTPFRAFWQGRMPLVLAAVVLIPAAQAIPAMAVPVAILLSLWVGINSHLFATAHVNETRGDYVARVFATVLLNAFALLAVAGVNAFGAHAFSAPAALLSGLTAAVVFHWLWNKWFPDCPLTAGAPSASPALGWVQNLGRSFARSGNEQVVRAMFDLLDGLDGKNEDMEAYLVREIANHYEKARWEELEALTIEILKGLGKAKGERPELWGPIMKAFVHRVEFSNTSEIRAVFEGLSRGYVKDMEMDRMILDPIVQAVGSRLRRASQVELEQIRLTFSRDGWSANPRFSGPLILILTDRLKHETGKTALSLSMGLRALIEEMDDAPPELVEPVLDVFINRIGSSLKPSCMLEGLSRNLRYAGLRPDLKAAIERFFIAQLADSKGDDFRSIVQGLFSVLWNADGARPEVVSPLIKELEKKWDQEGMFIVSGLEGSLMGLRDAKMDPECIDPVLTFLLDRMKGERGLIRSILMSSFTIIIGSSCDLGPDLRGKIARALAEQIKDNNVREDDLSNLYTQMLEGLAASKGMRPEDEALLVRAMTTRLKGLPDVELPDMARDLTRSFPFMAEMKPEIGGPILGVLADRLAGANERSVEQIAGCLLSGLQRSWEIRPEMLEPILTAIAMEIGHARGNGLRLLVIAMLAGLRSSENIPRGQLTPIIQAFVDRMRLADGADYRDFTNGMVEGLESAEAFQPQLLSPVIALLTPRLAGRRWMSHPQSFQCLVLSLGKSREMDPNVLEPAEKALVGHLSKAKGQELELIVEGLSESLARQNEMRPRVLGQILDILKDRLLSANEGTPIERSLIRAIASGLMSARDLDPRVLIPLLEVLEARLNGRPSAAGPYAKTIRLILLKYGDSANRELDALASRRFPPEWNDVLEKKTLQMSEVRKLLKFYKTAENQALRNDFLRRLEHHPSPRLIRQISDVIAGSDFFTPLVPMLLFLLSERGAPAGSKPLIKDEFVFVFLTKLVLAGQSSEDVTRRMLKLVRPTALTDSILENTDRTAFNDNPMFFLEIVRTCSSLERIGSQHLPELVRIAARTGPEARGLLLDIFLNMDMEEVAGALVRAGQYSWLSRLQNKWREDPARYPSPKMLAAARDTDDGVRSAFESADGPMMDDGSFIDALLMYRKIDGQAAVRALLERVIRAGSIVEGLRAVFLCGALSPADLGGLIAPIFSVENVSRLPAAVRRRYYSLLMLLDSPIWVPVRMEIFKRETNAGLRKVLATQVEMHFSRATDLLSAVYGSEQVTQLSRYVPGLSGMSASGFHQSPLAGNDGLTDTIRQLENAARRLGPAGIALALRWKSLEQIKVILPLGWDSYASMSAEPSDHHDLEGLREKYWLFQREMLSHNFAALELIVRHAGSMNRTVARAVLEHVEKMVEAYVALDPAEGGWARPLFDREFKNMLQDAPSRGPLPPDLINKIETLQPWADPAEIETLHTMINCLHEKGAQAREKALRDAGANTILNLNGHKFSIANISEEPLSRRGLITSPPLRLILEGLKKAEEIYPTPYIVIGNHASWSATLGQHRVEWSVDLADPDEGGSLRIRYVETGHDEGNAARLRYFTALFRALGMSVRVLDGKNGDHLLDAALDKDHGAFTRSQIEIAFTMAIRALSSSRNMDWALLTIANGQGATDTPEEMAKVFLAEGNLPFYVKLTGDTDPAMYRRYLEYLERENERGALRDKMNRSLSSCGLPTIPPDMTFGQRVIEERYTKVVEEALARGELVQKGKEIFERNPAYDPVGDAVSSILSDEAAAVRTAVTLDSLPREFLNDRPIGSVGTLWAVAGQV
ncbi:MAG: hypothetical protein HY548_03920, partial [Elusimicrobia bacterium]|nr:hypothetical protein [Elusimicrobiota bacterium]